MPNQLLAFPNVLFAGYIVLHLLKIQTDCSTPPAAAGSAYCGSGRMAGGMYVVAV
jgi:hypothetical protein